jgi:hypothetical protein
MPTPVAGNPSFSAPSLGMTQYQSSLVDENPNHTTVRPILSTVFVPESH